MMKYYHRPGIYGSNAAMPVSPAIIFFRVLFFMTSAVLLSSCEKPPSMIGSGLLPGSDFITIGSNGNLPVYSYTEYKDSIKSDNQTYSYLGKIYDPYFGETSSEFVTQLRLGSNWTGDIAAVDSVKLFLTFKNVTGDVDSEQILKISEITNELYADTTYYSNFPVHTDFEIAEIPLPALKADTINNIELRIPDEFGYYITRDVSKLFHSSTEPDFNSFFRGVYFRISDASDPLLLTLKLSAPGDYEYYNNYFVLYYRNSSGVQSTFFFIMDARSGNVSINKYSHNFAAAEPEKKINHINDGFRDTVSYLQCFNGVYTKLEIPGLTAYRDSLPLAVNKARIIVPVYLDEGLYKTSTVPAQIFLKYTTSSGLQYVVPDYSISSSLFDGTFNSTNRVYNFNVAAFVQKYLENTSDTIKPVMEMFLGQGASTNAILRANNNSNTTKFELTFTKLKQ
jgi:hypothetical protein